MNSFGRLFRISIFGESHGNGVGVTIDGVTPGLSLTTADFKNDLERRKSGKRGTTQRIEPDSPRLFTGVNEDRATGAPLTVLFDNMDPHSKDYAQLKEIFRPGHADFSGTVKFGGFNDIRGGGMFSARVTLGLVAAGVVAKKMIAPVTISAKLLEAGGPGNIDEHIEEAMREGDSIGGLIECRVTGVPAGLGEPFFDSVESLISHAIFAIPGVRGIEFGAGFKSSLMKGSECNDAFTDKNGTTKTNNAGGINGGITNGNDIVFRIAVKPTSSISKNQHTYNFKTNEMTELSVHGRHDTCVALRAPVIVEAATAIVLADLMLIEQKIPRVKRD